MSDAIHGKSKAAWGIAFASTIMLVIGLAGCLSSSESPEQMAGVVTGSGVVTVVAAPIAISITTGPSPGLVTVTTVSPHGFAVNDLVVVSGTASYNNLGVPYSIVSVISPTTFTIAATFGVNESGAVTAGGGVIAGCLTTGSGITLPAMNTVASRFTGVAPLSVFFDATGTTGGVAQPFHELLYTWNFGDPAGGASWAYGTGHNNSKNAASGPIAAHVFETPGTYAVTLTVTDGVSTVSNACMQIAVQDPNIVYAGTATRCYSRTGNFAGCPGGAVNITDPAGNFDVAIGADLATGRRLLFRGGETWINSNQAVLNVDGPWTIGSFGGGKATVQWMAGNSMLRFGANGSNSFKDARVIDLRIDGTDPPPPPPFSNAITGVDFSGTFNQITFLRFECIGVNVCFNQPSSKPNLAAPWDQFTVVDSIVMPTQGGSGGNGMFLLSTRNAILGNLFDNNNTGEHNFRSMYWNKLVVSSNTFQNPDAGKANLTLRGPTWYATFGPIPANTYSIYGVVSDNKFIGGPGINSPVNTSVDNINEARTRYLIFERNWWTGQSASGATLLSLNSSFSTIRNNILDLSAGSAGKCIEITNNGDSQTPTNNWIYNNTCYANQAVTLDVFGVAVRAGTANSTLKNNLLYAPSAPTATSIQDLSGVGTVGASGTFGNSSDVQAKAFPNFVVGVPVVPTNFQVTGLPGNYPVGTGVPVPVWSDFLGAQNVAPWDTGAVRH